jgi:hypothetical protein
MEIRGVSPSSPTVRTCCILSERQFPRPFKDNIFDYGKDKIDHKSGFAIPFFKDVSGIVYTCSAGFIDLGHVRDNVDLTAYYYRRLQVSGREGVIDAGTSITPPLHSGIITIKKNITSNNDLMSVAQSLSYDESAWHEIYSYWKGIGYHNSAFSPEDLVSNLLGTYVARNAILSGGNFDRSVTDELGKLLKSLGACKRSETENAFKKIRSLNWIKGGITSGDFLQKRNFGILNVPSGLGLESWRIVEPWYVSDISGCTSSTFPADLKPYLPPDIQSFYEMEFSLPLGTELWIVRQYIGSDTLKSTDFNAQIQKIRSNAYSLYKEGYDRP